MDKHAAEQICETLSETQTVVDVGGGASPFPRADFVVDAIPFNEQAKLGMIDIGITPRYCKDTWIQADLCDRTPWPIADKQFDFAVCSHLLEDVRDPIWICSELSRIAKAGYIEIPSRIIEQSLGVEHPRYAGYYHHRWLVTVVDGQLEFRHKPHLLHVVNDAIVTTVGVRRKINPKYSISSLWWTDTVQCVEELEFCEASVVNELIQFASKARKIADLTVASQRSFKSQLKHAVYGARLSRGGR